MTDSSVPATSAKPEPQPVGKNSPVLRFDRVSVRLADERFSDVEQVCFEIGSGGVATIRLTDRRDSPIPALAIGDRPLEVSESIGVSGKVEFDGRPWGTESHGDELARRGQIGLVLGQPGWVNNLSVLENVILRQLHHTRRPRREILTEVQEMAYAIGLSEVPPRRISAMGRSELRRCEWVRAFLGNPRLIVLERPCALVERRYWDALSGWVKRAAGEGTAVLWLSRDADELNLVSGLATARYVMSGDTPSRLEVQR